MTTTGKYYDYEHINDVLKGAVKLIKIAEEFEMGPIEYEVPASAPYKIYSVYIKIEYSGYHEIAIQEKCTSCIDYYQVSMKDYSVEYLSSCII